MTIRSPAAGHVIQKYQLEGDYVEEGARLFDVADLSTVWVEAQVFEDDLAFLKPDLVVHAFPKAFPNQEFTGKLAFIHPHLDAETRTLKVRFDLDNPGHDLRPGMYATVKLDVPAPDWAEVSAPSEGAASGAGRRRPRRPRAARAVRADGRLGAGVAGARRRGAGPARAGPQCWPCPESAVIDTGSRKVVYREAGPSLYEGVEVELGPRCGEFYPVVRGLRRATGWRRPARS